MANEDSTIVTILFGKVILVAALEPKQPKGIVVKEVDSVISVKVEQLPNA